MISEANIPWNELLRKFQAGESDAGDAICRELSVRLGVIAQYRLWGWSRQDREDLVQESLFVLLQKLKQIKSNPQMYACRVLRNKIGDALRRHKSNRTPIQIEAMNDSSSMEISLNLFIDPESEYDRFSAEIEVHELKRLVKNALKKLQAFCRALFLGLMEGQSVDGLYAYFKHLEPSLKRGTFHKRVYECRKRLKKLIREQL